MNLHPGAFQLLNTLPRSKKAHYNKEVFTSLIQMAFAMNEVTNRAPESLKELLGFLGSARIGIKEPDIKDHPLDSPFLVGLIEGLFQYKL